MHKVMGESPDFYNNRLSDVEEAKAEVVDLDIFDGGLVLGYFERLEQILRRCPIDLYAASSLKHPWPYRLQKASDCAQASFWRSQHRILDSNIMNPEISNEDVLKEASEKQATAVVAKDYLPFKIYDQTKYNLPKLTGVDNHRKATTKSIEEFIKCHNPNKHPPAYIPLQPPYDDHIREIRPLVVDSHLDEKYMLGGLKDASPEKRIREAHNLREEVGKEPELHGLGWGPSATLIEELRENRYLIDSLDNSGPSQAIQNENILDKEWQEQPFELVEGKMRNSVAGVFEFGMLLQAAHRLSTLNTEFENDSPQQELSVFQQE